MTRRGFALVALFVPGLASLLMVGIPAWLIQPFRHQTPRDLDLSFLLRAWSPSVTLALAALTLFGAIRLWKRPPGILRRIAIVLAVILSISAAWASRQNHFEAMFQPLASPVLVPASSASFLPDADRVLGVALNGEAAAYPVRQLAYHHLVHDRVGGVEIVVTY